VLARLISFAGALIELAEAEMAVGDEGGAAAQPLTPPMVRPELMRCRNA
jgi:hypothetical protein